MILIRRATPDDVAELAGLFDLYRIFYRKEPDIEGAKKFLAERIERNESVIYLAVDDGRIAGFTQLYPQFSSTRMKRSWLLNDLFVLEEYRGRGISRQLIETAKQLAKATGAGGLMLETEKTNIVGNSLYSSAGFVLSSNNFYWWENKS